MAKFFRQKPSALSLLVIVLLVLLSVLATLQYRWLNRASHGEREAMQTILMTKTRSFCEEFDREITRAYAIFKMDADAFRAADRNDQYAARFDKWITISPHSKIVKDVFLVESGSSGNDGEINGERLRLLRFNETAKAFESAEWTSVLENLRRNLERQRQNSDFPSHNIFSSGIESIAEEVPALISSIASVHMVDAKTEHKKFDWRHPLGYVIVALDSDYIKNEMFPALARKHFASSGDGLDYNLIVVSRAQPEKLIYQSDLHSELSENPPASAPDAKDKLLNIGFTEVKSYDSERVYDTTSSTNQEKPNFTLIVPALKDAKEADGGKEDAAKVLLVDDSARWELKANHQLGSLDAAIANARRWNLAMSFGILLLLGVSIVMIAVLTSRSQRLARRQIEFVAGVSHEFRTPLAVIHSLSENLAAGRIKDSLQVERYGAKIHKDVRRLTEMVEQVLEFAGAERGKFFYDKNPVAVGNLVERILAANAPLLRSMHWNVECEIEADLPLVSADESALERAFQNLISNAVKYGGDGDGNRRLKVETYQVSNNRRPEINIVVEDNGDGISPDELPHVFEPFFRGRKAIDAQIHGSGLGLNLVKQIIEAHGGRVTLESARGRGSRFVLRLPATAANADSLQTSEEI